MLTLMSSKSFVTSQPGGATPALAAERAERSRAPAALIAGYSTWA